MRDVLRGIVLQIRDVDSAGEMLLYRNDEEREFLKSWLERAEPEISPPEETFSSRTSPDSEDKTATESVAVMIDNCKKCANVFNRKAGWGSGLNHLMIVFNFPGNIDKIEKKNLAEESKALFKKMMGAINITLSECYITNMIKCDTDDSLNRPGLMYKNCDILLRHEIREMKPDVIVVMGNASAMTRLRYEETEGKNIVWHEIDHPMILLKNPELKTSAWETLQKLKMCLNKSASHV